MKWLGGNANSSLFPRNLTFSFFQKFEGIGINEIRFNEIFSETPKMSLYIQSNSNIVIKWHYSFPSMLLSNNIIDTT